MSRLLLDFVRPPYPEGWQMSVASSSLPWKVVRWMLVDLRLRVLLLLVNLFLMRVSKVRIGFSENHLLVMWNICSLLKFQLLWGACFNQVKKHAETKIDFSARSFHFYLLWLSKAPASSGGTSPFLKIIPLDLNDTIDCLHIT